MLKTLLICYSSFYCGIIVKAKSSQRHIAYCIAHPYLSHVLHLCVAAGEGDGAGDARRVLQLVRLVVVRVVVLVALYRQRALTLRHQLLEDFLRGEEQFNSQSCYYCK